MNQAWADFSEWFVDLDWLGIGVCVVIVIFIVGFVRLFDRFSEGQEQ